MFSNKHFDPVAGSRLYNEYLEHYIYAEEQGVEGFMLNEHHNAPFCMQAKCNIFASILAAVTKKAKIVLLGNPLPLAENPVRLAEELAMIDMISKGRLVSGFVRGGGQEQLANGVNPAFNRERFEEAHDLVVAAWTRQGPFRWEGTHYQHRVVNPWAVPLQKPYPRVWIPGVLSQETIIWAAQAALSLYRAQHLDRGDQEDLGAVRQGRARDRLRGGPGEPRLPAAGPRLRQRGKGREERPPVPVDAGRVHRPRASGVANPSGYFSPTLRRNFVEFAVGRAENPRGRPTFEQQVADGRVIFGTPKTVIPKLRRVLEETRPGIYGIWGNDGRSATRMRAPASASWARRSCRRCARSARNWASRPVRVERAGAPQIFDRPQERKVAAE